MKSVLRLMLFMGLASWIGCQSATEPTRPDAGGRSADPVVGEGDATSEFTLVSLKVPNMH